MNFVEILAKTVGERAREPGISAWQKADEMAELQRYITAGGANGSTRELARLTNVPQTRVAEQLTIASSLNRAALKQFGVSPTEIGVAEHRTLLRIAKLPAYLRQKPVRDAVQRRSD